MFVHTSRTDTKLFHCACVNYQSHPVFPLEMIFYTQCSNRASRPCESVSVSPDPLTVEMISDRSYTGCKISKPSPVGVLSGKLSYSAVVLVLFL